MKTRDPQDIDLVLPDGRPTRFVAQSTPASGSRSMIWLLIAFALFAYAIWATQRALRLEHDLAALHESEEWKLREELDKVEDDLVNERGKLRRATSALDVKDRALFEMDGRLTVARNDLVRAKADYSAKNASLAALELEHKKLGKRLQSYEEEKLERKLDARVSCGGIMGSKLRVVDGKTTTDLMPRRVGMMDKTVLNLEAGDVAIFEVDLDRLPKKQDLGDQAYCTLKLKLRRNAAE